MKLHLPKMLSAALLATFAAVAGTTQAAITMTDITQWDGYDEAAGVAHVGNTGDAIYNAKVQQDYQWNNYWNFIYTVDAASLTEGTYSLDTLALTQRGAEGYVVASSLVMASTGTGTVTHGGWNQTGKTADIDLSSAKDITFVLSRNNNGGIVSLTGYVDGNFDTAAFTLNVNTNLSFSGTTVSTVSYGSTGGLTAFNNGNNTYRQVADNAVGTFDITKAGVLLGSQVTAADLGKYYTPVTTLVWNGTAPTATWDITSESWLNDGQPAQYVSGYGTTANFNAGEFAKNVTVSGAIKAATVNVKDDYTFTVQSGSSLTADALNVAADKKATVAGEGTVSLGSLTGALAIEEGSTVNLDGTITLTATQTLQVSGEGTLGVTTLQVTGGTHTITNDLNVTGGGDGKGGTNRSLGLAVTGGTVTLEGDTHISGAMYDSVGTVNIGNGTDEVRVTTNRVEFGDAGGTGESILNVKANATLHVKGEDKANSYSETALVMGEWNGVSTANIAGKLYADNATAYVGDSTVTFNIENGGLMAVKGLSQNQHKDAKTETINLNLLEGGTLVLGENGIDSRKPINVHLGAGELGISADSVTISKDIALAGGATTFNTAKYVWEGENDTRELVEGSEGGTITINGSITGDGTITKVGAGTLVLSGTNNVLIHTIAANEGTMTLYGSYEIADIAPTGGQTIYTDGEHDNNGYSTATGNVVVYEGDADVTATDATFTFRGSTVTVTDGKYALPGTQDTTTYFINGDTDSYGWIDEHKKAELTGGIVVTENATLKADKNMSMSVVSASSKGTVEIDNDVVVTAAGGTQNVKLAGDGIYALANGVQTLGSVNADNLSGYVRLSGNIANIDLAGNLGNANVEFKGLSGHFKNLTEGTDDTYSGNIHLENDGDTPSIKITDGYSRTESEYIFAGDISGEGTWELNCNATQHYVFTGSLGDWTGEFLVTKSGGNNNGTSLAFRRNATNVNASIARNGGTLKLIAENDVTFREDVTGVTSLTVTEGNSATFEGTTSIGSLIGEGNVTANGDLSLTGTTTTTSVEEGATNFTGTLTLGASLTVNGNVDLGGHLNAGEYAITVEGSLTLTEGSTIASVISNSGFVSLTGLTLEESVFTETEGEDAHFDLAGRMTDDANYFEGTAADYVRVVNGGTSTGSGLAWRDKNDYVLTADGKIITGVEDIDYGTFYVGGEISTSAINASEHVADITNINVGDGAKLTVDEVVEQAAIHAGDGATVEGEHAQESVEIAADATVTYTNGITSTEGVFVFDPANGVRVTNKGGSAATYGGLDDGNMAVEADALFSSAIEEYVVNNQLSVSRVTHQG